VAVCGGGRGANFGGGPRPHQNPAAPFGEIGGQW